MLEAGDYLIAEVATINGDISAVEVQGLNGAKGYLVNENGKLYLRVEGMRDPTSITWSGAVDSNWDIATTANFVNGGSADIFVTGDEVTFNDDAVNKKVSVGSGIMPSEVIFDNYTSNYTLDGNPVQSGTFTQKGAGTTTISNTNSFTSATIAGGNVAVASLANTSGVDLGSLGDANAGITIKNGGALQTSAAINTTQKITIGEDGGGFNVTGSTLTLDAQLNGGKNPVFKKGSGTLVFSTSAVNNNFGVFTVEAGTIQCEADYGTGSATFKDTLVLSNGTTFRHNNSTGNYNSDVTKVKINSGSANWYLDGRCNYQNTLSGAGTLKLYPQGDISRTMLQLKGDEFTGTVDMEVNGSYNYLNGYDGYLLNLPNGTLNVGSGFTLSTQNVQDGKTTDILVAKVTGTGTLTGSGRLYVGSDGDDYFTYSTPCSLKVYKVGTNEMRLTSGKILAAMYVNGGSVRLNSTSTLAHGAYTTQINSGGRLYGAHYLNNCYINKGGLLDVCSVTKTTGTTKIENLITLYAGGEMNLYLRTNGASTYSSKITAATLNLRGNLNIKAVSDIDGATHVFEPAVGQTFTLWEVTKFSFDASTLVLTLPALPSGMEWDTSELFAAKGVLKIVQGSTLKGDVNGDGVVNGTDIQAVINFIIASEYNEKADVNEDGIVNGTDIQEIINIIVSVE